jgi:RHS repeat-associated protein
VAYTHNSDGLRVRKHGAINSPNVLSTLVFVYDLSPTSGGLPASYPHLLGEYNASGQPVREYIWLGDTPVAMAMADPANPLGQPKLYAIHTDHLNSPQVVVDRSTAATRWRWMTEPFGTTQPEESINGSAAFTQPLRFPGQYADGETGMAYNVMRSYIPGVGRYSQSDPIGLEGGINTYAYVDGSPTTKTDSLGLSPDGSGGNTGSDGSQEKQCDGDDCKQTFLACMAQCISAHDPLSDGFVGSPSICHFCTFIWHQVVDPDV